MNQSYVLKRSLLHVFLLLLACFSQEQGLALWGMALGLAQPRRESRMGRDVAALLQVLNNGVAKLWRMGGEFQLLWANSEFCRLTGHKGVRGARRRPEKLDWSFLHPEDKVRLLALLPLLERELSPHTEEYRLKLEGWPSYALTLCCMWTEDNCAMYVCSLDSAESAWQTSERLQWERRRLILLSNFANEILFEYNISTDTLLHYDVLHTLFPSDAPIYNLKNQLYNHDVIHTEDVPELIKSIDDSADGPRSTGKFRLRGRDGQYQWYQVQYISLNYEDNRKRILGRLINVHANTELLASLELQNSLDPLTGILHNTAVQQAIDTVLDMPSPNAGHALLVMDIDNFKQVNDNFGHSTGDAVIRQVVHCLKECFRSSDISGRVGGDEFVVLLRGIHSVEAVYEKARKFSQKLQEGEYACSVSIGISIAPQHGSTYQQLFARADKAMYQAKAKYKGGIDFA